MAPIYSNNWALVNLYAHNPCPGVRKPLLKTVLGNSDIAQPTLERLTCAEDSPHHYLFSLMSSPFEMMAGE